MEGRDVTAAALTIMLVATRLVQGLPLRRIDDLMPWAYAAHVA